MVNKPQQKLDKMFSLSLLCTLYMFLMLVRLIKLLIYLWYINYLYSWRDFSRASNFVSHNFALAMASLRTDSFLLFLPSFLPFFLFSWQKKNLDSTLWFRFLNFLTVSFLNYHTCRIDKLCCMKHMALD